MSIEEMEFSALQLRAKIKTAKRQDFFFDAAKHEAQLEILEQQIKEKNDK